MIGFHLSILSSSSEVNPDIQIVITLDNYSGGDKSSSDNTFGYSSFYINYTIFCLLIYKA